MLKQVGSTGAKGHHVFILGAIIGFAIAAVCGALLLRREQRRTDELDRERFALSRHNRKLEKSLANAQADTDSAVRDERLRNAREFGQYKILLRRADIALAQARAERAEADMSTAA